MSKAGNIGKKGSELKKGTGAKNKSSMDKYTPAGGTMKTNPKDQTQRPRDKGEGTTKSVKRGKK